MKFVKGQEIVCISEKSEWGHTVPNFDEMLKIALGSIKVPVKNELCVVINPFQLHYEGKTYIEIEGYPDNIFSDSGFEPIQYDYEHNEEDARIAMHIKN